MKTQASLFQTNVTRSVRFMIGVRIKFCVLAASYAILSILCIHFGSITQGGEKQNFERIGSNEGSKRMGGGLTFSIYGLQENQYHSTAADGEQLHLSRGLGGLSVVGRFSTKYREGEN